MSDVRKIKTALISVYHKDGLDDILSMLHAQGVKFLSTGGTQTFIEQLGYPCSAVEDLTSYPSILGGRVKTLHPKVFGGILGRRSNESDVTEMEKYEIPGIDLIIVDLYPFEATVASGASEADIITQPGLSPREHTSALFMVLKPLPSSTCISIMLRSGVLSIFTLYV